jgi:D-alanyl-D-alanine carboxypeptidase/D-alanyl-D-alanine-endopeptidase (penicillin-binding protein 4)
LRPSDLHKVAVPGPDALIDGARLNGKVTYAVAETASGRLLESRSGTTLQPPASVTKAVTALYALDVLGASHRFRTSVLATGGISNGVVQGDLILAGGADPTLDTDGLADLAAQLKAAGVREVRGRYLVYDGALPQIDRIDPDQPDHVGYNPGMSGLALNFNRVHFEWRRGNNGYAVTMDARTAKYRPDVTVAKMQIVDRRAPVYTYNSTKRTDQWTVAKGALGKRGARWLPVRLPGLYAADVFATMARSQGIALGRVEPVKTLPQGELVALRQSAPLRDILRDMLKFSNNLIAEMVGLAASVARKGQVRSLKASASEMNRWAAQSLGMSRVKLVDHSGLGDASKMSANDMVSALVAVKGKDYRAMLKPIGMRDAKGRPDKGHPITVRAKTGTLNFVSSLAGYMTAPDGRELAFAIFTADMDTRSRIGKANREAPQGAKGWNRRSKNLQQRLIERWGTLYGS